MKPPFSYVPLAPVLTALLSGVIAGRCAGVSMAGRWCILAIVVLSVLAIKFRYRYVAVLGAGVVVGWCAWWADAYTHRCTAPVDGVHDATGVVERVGESERAYKLIVSLDGDHRGNCYLTVPGFSHDFRQGDEVWFRARFEPAEIRRDVDGDVDLTAFFFRNHIGCSATVDMDSIHITGQKGGLIRKIKNRRGYICDLISRSSLSDDAQGFVCALLVGDYSMMGDDARPVFASAGLSHILALSGMHIAVVAAIISMLLWPLSWIGRHRLRLACVIIVLWLYAVLTGLSPSVTRAVIMFSLVLGARIIGRGQSAANSLCVAAMVIAVFDPRVIFTAGFQLSFMAVLALIVIPPLINLPRFQNPVVRWLCNYMIYTLSAVAGTWLLVVYFFHQSPVYFLLSNMPCALMLPLIMSGGWLIVLLQAVGIGCELLDVAVNTMCGWVESVATSCADLPYSAIDGLHLSVTMTVVGYLAIGVLIAGVYYKRRVAVGIGLAVLPAVIVTAFSRTVVDETLFVSRQSDAISVVYTDGGVAYVMTSSVVGDDVTEYIKDRYSDFMNDNRIDSINRVDCGRCAWLTFGRHEIVLINSDDYQPSERKANYVIVCRGFKSNIVDLVKDVPCDTVLLGPDVNAVRRRRYYMELEQAGQAVRDLSSGYGLVLTGRQERSLSYPCVK